MTDDVTVVVTTFAARPKRMLERAVESANPQAAVIIADDGDGPIDCCYASWWEGVYRARTPYVCILHDDDWYEPDFVAALRRLMASDAGYAFSNGTVHMPDGATQTNLSIDTDRPHLAASESMVRNFLCLTNTISPSSCMFRRTDVLQNLTPWRPPARRVVSGPDLLLTLFPLAKYPAVGIDPRPLVNMQAHEGSVTTRAQADPELRDELAMNYIDAFNYFAKVTGLVVHPGVSRTHVMAHF